jgi:hypothetical protein
MHFYEGFGTYVVAFFYLTSSVGTDPDQRIHTPE